MEEQFNKLNPCNLRVAYPRLCSKPNSLDSLAITRRVCQTLHNSKLKIQHSKLYFDVIFCNFVQLFAIFCNFFIRTFTHKTTPKPQYQPNIKEYDTFHFFSFKSTQNSNQNRYDSDFVIRLAFLLEIRYNGENRYIKHETMGGLSFSWNVSKIPPLYNEFLAMEMGDETKTKQKKKCVYSNCSRLLV